MQCLTRSLHHAQPAGSVDIQNVGTKPQERAQAIADRIRDIVQLQIEEHLFLLLLEPCNDIPAERIEKLHAYLVEADTVTKTCDKLLRRRTRRHVKCRNQPIICHAFTPL